MANIELLNPATHARLRVRPASPETPHFVQIFAPEFPAAASCCPVLLTKEPDTGAFYAGAMFGFKEGENLVGSPADRGGFHPLLLRRDGFFMADQKIAIDRDHARFSETEGDPLFDAAQQPQEALRSIQRILGDIHGGLEQTKTFIAALTDLKLIEGIDITIGTGAQRLVLQGLYTVSLDRLRDVDDAQALRLFRASHLALIYAMAGSLRHIGRLARLRERAS